MLEGQIGAVVELNCETDFVARGEEFQELARGIAMHVSAMNPRYLNDKEVPAEVLNREKEIMLEQLTEQQKSKVDKIMPGKIAKFYEENCLVNQAYIKDESGKLTVSQLIENLSAKVGEKITLRRFVRFEVGEGIEKAQADLAAEVAATIAGN
jgi:elongation factor Ts